MTTAASQRARIAAYTRAALYDGKEVTAKARTAFMSSFLARVPVDLPEAERLKRAEALKKAHFTRLAYQSSIARRGKSKGGVGRRSGAYLPTENH